MRFGESDMENVNGTSSHSDCPRLGKYMQKQVSLIWKLLTLLLLGLSGIFMCFLGVDQRISKSRYIPALDNSTDHINCALPANSYPFPIHFPNPNTYKREECACTPVHNFVILSMQRVGSGWFETLLNNHPNVSSHGEILSVESRRDSFSSIRKTLDTIFNLDWNSSASKNECTSAVGFKWMLNQGAMEFNREVLQYLKEKGVSVIFLFRRNILRRYVSILANGFDKRVKLLNGTHKAHVHSEAEAAVLAKYKPIVNVTFLPAYLQRIQQITDDAHEFFNGTRNTLIFYEEIRNPETILQIQNFLGVKQRKLTSRHVKIHTKPLSEQIENWQEVNQRLKGTSFEQFLQEF